MEDEEDVYERLRRKRSERNLIRRGSVLQLLLRETPAELTHSSEVQLLSLSENVGKVSFWCVHGLYSGSSGISLYAHVSKMCLLSESHSFES